MGHFEGYSEMMYGQQPIAKKERIAWTIFTFFQITQPSAQIEAAILIYYKNITSLSSTVPLFTFIDFILLNYENIMYKISVC